MSKPASPMVNSLEVAPRTLNQIWNNVEHLHTSLAVKFVLATFTPVPGVKQWWEPGGRPDLIHVLIGHSGCGKTQMLQQALTRNGFDIEKVKGEATIEDIVPIPTQRPDPDNPSMSLKLAQTRNFGKPASERGLGALFIDEMTSGDVEHQKVFRGLISDNMLAQKLADPRWLPVGAANPTLAEYLDTRAVTRSLEDRCFYLPVKSDTENTLRYFGGVNALASIEIPDMGKPVPLTPLSPDGAGGMNESLYTFLVMNRSDSASDFMRFNSARRWMNISWVLTRLQSCGFLSQHEILTWFRTVNHEEVGAAYAKHIEMGADPSAYPLLGHRILAATQNEMRTYVDRIRTWKKDPDKKFLVKLSAWDLAGTFVGRQDVENPRLNDAMAANVKDFFAELDETMLCNVFREVSHRDLLAQMHAILGGLPGQYQKVRKLVEDLQTRSASAMGVK